MTTNALDNKTINDWLRQASGHAQQQPQQQSPPPKAVANAGAGLASEVPSSKLDVNTWLRSEAGFGTGRIYK